MFTKEMQRALEADGEKLRQLTGEDHGPHFEHDEPEFCVIHGYTYMMDSPGNPIPWCVKCEKVVSDT